MEVVITSLSIFVSLCAFYCIWEWCITTKICINTIRIRRDYRCSYLCCNWRCCLWCCFCFSRCYWCCWSFSCCRSWSISLCSLSLCLLNNLWSLCGCCLCSNCRSCSRLYFTLYFSLIFSWYALIVLFCSLRLVVCIIMYTYRRNWCCWCCSSLSYWICNCRCDSCNWCV